MEDTASHAASAKPAAVRRLGVIGDVHGEHERLESVLDWFATQDLDAVACTGDVADGRGCINVSCRLLREAGVLTVAGNHDRWLLEDRVRHVGGAHRRDELDPENLAFLNALPRTRDIDTVAGRLLLCHGIGSNDLGKVWPGTGRTEVRRSEQLDSLLAAGEHRFVVNGHLHFRVLIDFADTLLMNAGTLKGERPGVSILDLGAGTISVFHLESGRAPQPGNRHPLVPGPGRRIWRDTTEFDGRWDPVLL
ncbi:MAG: metallophosphoesterase family protein [Pseudomonadales bacterium]